MGNEGGAERLDYRTEARWGEKEMMNAAAEEESVVWMEVDGLSVAARPGASVAAALLNAGVIGFRSSVGGEARGPLCGMGSCQECRVRIDGVAQQRACLRSVREGMRVVTGG